MACVPLRRKLARFYIINIFILVGIVLATESEENPEKKKEKKTRQVDLNDFGPDDLAKILKAQKDKNKDVNELKDRFLATVSSKESKSSDVVQQTEEHEPQKVDGESGSKKPPPEFPEISSLFPDGLPANLPYVPPRDGKPIQMIATTADKTQLVCECYASGSRPIQDNRFNPPYPNSAQQPVSPFLGPIGSHFARKPKIFSHKKPKINPFEALLMGFIKKPKRKPSTSYYPPPPAPGFFYPNQFIDYNMGLGEYGSTKGNSRVPLSPYLPPSPGASIKGSPFSRRGSQSDGKTKWHWYLDHYNDAQKGFNLT